MVTTILACTKQQVMEYVAEDSEQTALLHVIRPGLFIPFTLQQSYALIALAETHTIINSVAMHAPACTLAKTAACRLAPNDIWVLKILADKFPFSVMRVLPLVLAQALSPPNNDEIGENTQEDGEITRTTQLLDELLYQATSFSTDNVNVEEALNDVRLISLERGLEILDCISTHLLAPECDRYLNIAISFLVHHVFSKPQGRIQRTAYFYATKQAISLMCKFATRSPLATRRHLEEICLGGDLSVFKSPAVTWFRDPWGKWLGEWAVSSNEASNNPPVVNNDDDDARVATIRDAFRQGQYESLLPLVVKNTHLIRNVREEILVRLPRELNIDVALQLYLLCAFTCPEFAQDIASCIEIRLHGLEAQNVSVKFIKAKVFVEAVRLVEGVMQ